MANGWTGGQYGVYRLVLAGALAAKFGVLGAIVGLPLALGLGDAVAAGAYLVLFVAAVAVSPFPITTPRVGAAALLALHLMTPARPYGAWSARGRADPGGGWRLPAPVHWSAGALFLLCVALAAHTESLGALWLPLALLAFDPAWIPPKREGAPLRLFYDGDCGLCHAAVRFVLAEDRGGSGFRFAPLASDSFARLASPEARAALPDSIVLALPDGRLLARSAAVLEIGERLGGLWRAFARAARAVPEPWLDRAYDAIARNRKRFVRKPEGVCPLVSPELRARFE